MSSPGIRVEGLKEFRQQLRRVERDLPKGLRLAGDEAAQLIAKTSRRGIPRGPSKGGHAADSIKVVSGGVTAGGRTAPHFGWLDFGGTVGRGRGVKRPFLRTGRYIWRAYADQDKIIKAHLEADLTRLLGRAGIRATSGGK